MLRHADIPGGHFYAYVRNEFLYDQRSGHGEVTPCAVYGIVSQTGHALAFDIHLNNGASWARIPIHALAHLPTAPLRPLTELQLWDCFGDDMTVTRHAYLRHLRVTALGQSARYVCTIDWLNNGYSDTPDQHKYAHMLALDDGNFAALPNNRVLFHDASFVEHPLEGNPGYVVNSHTWYAEDTI